MPKQRKLLFTIADGEHVRFVRPTAHNVLHVDQKMDSAAAHKRSSDLRTDRPGAAFQSNSTAHHCFAPRHDPHTLEKDKFARVVAALLNEAAASGVFDDLVIVAPAHTLAAIHADLNITTLERLVGTLMKDLVITPTDELWPHLRQWIRPVHRA